jgi:hypothetical protein
MYQNVCTKLKWHFSGVSRVFPASHYGQGYGGVMLSELKCNGNEKDIKQCSAKWGYNRYCDHRDDLGVSCSGKVFFIFHIYEKILTFW